MRVPKEGRAFEVKEVDGDICLPPTEVKMDEHYEMTIYFNNSVKKDGDTHKIRLRRSLEENLSVR